MNRVALPLFLLMCGSTFSIAQSDSHPDTTKVQQRYSLLTLTKYCDGVERFSNTQPPRIFAQKSAALGRSPESVTQQPFDLDEYSLDRRPLQSEKTSFVSPRRGGYNRST
jgi:hypothetical protein